MSQQSHQDTHRGPPRKPGPHAALPIHHANISSIIPAMLIRRRLNHAGREIQITDEALLLVKRQAVAPRDIRGQACGLDEDGGDPVGVGAQELLRSPQVVVDVRGSGQHDGTEPFRHVAREVVVDGGRAEQDQLRQLEARARFRFDPLQGLDHGGGAVLADATAGDVVVGRHHEEHGSGVTHAVGHELDVVDAALEDLDMLVVDYFGQKALQLGLVAAVGVDFVVWRLEEVLDEGGAAIAGATEDGVGGHGDVDNDNDDDGRDDGREGCRLLVWFCFL